MMHEKFIERQIGPRKHEILDMLDSIGEDSLDLFIDKVVPKNIRLADQLSLGDGISEYEYLKKIKRIASKNKIYKSYIGTGYYNTVFPPVIQRNILENPNWYTSYTPYQAEISQGRLEGLINFQTMVTEITAMEIANASLLDESTAAAEAMAMAYRTRSKAQVKNNTHLFFVDENIFPQHLAVLKSRSESLAIDLEVGNINNIDFSKGYFGILVQYPNSVGEIIDYRNITQTASKTDCKVVVVADILSLTILKPPGEWGADVVVGSSQRFGIPMGFGGPHAGFFATKKRFARYVPGRIIGVSVDKFGKQAFRMALQTREQHIKREKATSNICTSQSLLAIMSAIYAIYHGKEGLVKMAERIHASTSTVAQKLKILGYEVITKNFFDTLQIRLPDNITYEDILIHTQERKINVKYFNNKTVGISIDETTTIDDLNLLISSGPNGYIH